MLDASTSSKSHPAAAPPPAAVDSSAGERKGLDLTQAFDEVFG
jgi:hypothetical protein